MLVPAHAKVGSDFRGYDIPLTMLIFKAVGCINLNILAVMMPIDTTKVSPNLVLLLLFFLEDSNFSVQVTIENSSQPSPSFACFFAV